MNIVDACKTGKPIRRPGSSMPGWFCSKHLLDIFGAGDLRPWSREDFLADDWQVKPDPGLTDEELLATMKLYAGLAKHHQDKSNIARQELLKRHPDRLFCWTCDALYTARNYNMDQIHGAYCPDCWLK